MPCESRQALQRRLQEAEAVVKALRNDHVDAVIGAQGVSVLRLREVEHKLEELNRELEQRVERRTSDLRMLTQRLANAREEERLRIATGLHDYVCQLLAACQLKVAQAERCEEPEMRKELLRSTDDLLSAMSDQVRDLTFELSTSCLFQTGFVPAARELCALLRDRTGVHFSFYAQREDLEVPERVRLTLYRCMRELLNNVVKHADVDRAEVGIEEDPQPTRRLRLKVHDHGKGFETASLDKPLTRQGGFGLYHLRETLRDVNGTLFIRSVPGDGTEAIAEVELDR